MWGPTHHSVVKLQSVIKVSFIVFEKYDNFVLSLETSKRKSRELMLTVDPLMKAAAAAISDESFTSRGGWGDKKVAELMETLIELANLGRIWVVRI